MSAARPGDGEGGCCPRCHFRWEERYVIPLLPVGLALQLLKEHARILREPAGTRRAMLLEHGRREEAACLPYLPAPLRAELKRQHDAH